MIGTVLAGRYEIIEVIGQGSMGIVYKAWHMDHKQPIAIKMLHEELATDPLARERFEREVQVISRLDHPHLLRVYDFGTSEQGRPFIVTELIEGASLESIIGELGHLPIDLTLRIFIQTCAGLAHAHKQGVIHQDLKPSNLMLVKHRGEISFVKIVDFGIAKLVQLDELALLPPGGTKLIIGSPLYMSPEQCRGENLDPRSDIYSLGSVIYRTITNTPPIIGKDLADLLDKQINRLPMKFGIACPGLDIPSDLESIVFKAMAKDKEDRYQTMGEFRKALLLFGKRYAEDANFRSSLTKLRADRSNGSGNGAVAASSGENLIQSSDVTSVPKPFDETTEIIDN